LPNSTGTKPSSGSSTPTRRSPDAPRSGLRGLIVPAAATLVVFIVLVGLGIWQLQRLGWKQDLIARVDAGLSASPVEAPGPAEWSTLDFAEREYQPVTVTGVFDEQGEVYVAYTLTRPNGPFGGIGYLVMTPLLTGEGWTVYVNRGFVPREQRYPNQRPEGRISGETAVTGLLREPSTRSWFTPGDSISDNVWFSRDPSLYAQAYSASSAVVAPYIIDAFYDPELPGGLPQGGTTIIDFPNNHLGYAITWFGLAAALLAVFVVFAGGRLRRQSGDDSNS
jgi:surfeit locus 1 family protein